MIIGFALSLIYQFVAFLVGLLPTGGVLSSDWVSAVYAIWGYVNVFSFIVPVGMLVTCLGIAMAFHGFIFAWKGVHWLWSLIRGGRVH